MQIEIFDTPDDATTAAAKMLAEALDRDGTLGLAGGSTPKEAYRKLAALRQSWSDEILWLGDERWTAPDADDCNARMAREALGEKAAERVLPMLDGATDRTPDDVAAAYEARLVGFRGRGWPGTVLLGLGDDGHTASLFPGTDALDEKSRLFAPNWVGQMDTWRLTATRALLSEAGQLIFLVCGASKAWAVRQLVDPPAGNPPVPSRLVAEENANVVLLADHPAAGDISL